MAYINIRKENAGVLDLSESADLKPIAQTQAVGEGSIAVAFVHRMLH